MLVRTGDARVMFGLSKDGDFLIMNNADLIFLFAKYSN